MVLPAPVNRPLAASNTLYWHCINSFEIFCAEQLLHIYTLTHTWISQRSFVRVHLLGIMNSLKPRWMNVNARLLFWTLISKLTYFYQLCPEEWIICWVKVALSSNSILRSNNKDQCQLLQNVLILVCNVFTYKLKC